MDAPTKMQAPGTTHRRTSSGSSVLSRSPFPRIGSDQTSTHHGYDGDDYGDDIREETEYSGMSAPQLHHPYPLLAPAGQELPSSLEQQQQQQQQTSKTRRRRGSLRKVALLGRSSNTQPERRTAPLKPVPSSAMSAAAAAASSSTVSATSPSGAGSIDSGSGLGISNLAGSTVGSGSGSSASAAGSGLGISDITPRPSMEGYASRAASAAVAAALLSPTPKSTKQTSKFLPRTGDGNEENGMLGASPSAAAAVAGSGSGGAGSARRHDRRRSSSSTIASPLTTTRPPKVPPTVPSGAYSTTDDEDALHMATKGASSSGALAGNSTIGGVGGSGVVSNAAAAAAAAATSLLRADPRLGGANGAASDAYLAGSVGGDSGVATGRLLWRRGGSGAGAQLLQQQQPHTGQLPSAQAPSQKLMLHQRKLSQSQQQQQKQPISQQSEPHQLHHTQQLQHPHPHQTHHQEQIQSTLHQSPPLHQSHQNHRNYQNRQNHQNQHQHHQHQQLVQQPPPLKQRAKSPLALTDLADTTLQQPSSSSAATTAEVGGSTGGGGSAVGVGVNVGVVGVGVNVAVNVGGDPDWDYAETAWWGWVMLIVTWVVFVTGMGSCLGVWSWAWDVGKTPYAPPELEDDPTLPIVGYYPALLILTCVMAWVWVVVAWIGMKYFRHAKIGGD